MLYQVPFLATEWPFPIDARFSLIALTGVTAPGMASAAFAPYPGCGCGRWQAEQSTTSAMICVRHTLINYDLRIISYAGRSRVETFPLAHIHIFKGHQNVNASRRNPVNDSPVPVVVEDRLPKVPGAGLTESSPVPKISGTEMAGTRIAGTLTANVLVSLIPHPQRRPGLPRGGTRVCSHRVVAAMRAVVS